MRPAIRIDSLSKSYRLGQQRGAGYRTLRESLTGSAAGVWHGLKRVGSRFLGNGRGKAVADPGEFWALKDVSLEVQPGEVVGIIGRNGAGKSTLLKILSRITEPTSGRAEVHGRMGSLLEIGTGFHPELTGRENIYLNGSILGMRRREIARKFDEIVAFSEIERFLDMPVKRYSSGMYVRLAFAVAAHLEPEILIVDEVLAVGDAQFQQKCLGQMAEVSKAGRTILFVSHNLAAVKALCSRAIYIQSGQIELDSTPESAIIGYFRDVRSSGSGLADLHNHPRRSPASIPIMTEASITTNDGQLTSKIRMGGELSILVKFDCSGHGLSPVLGVVIKDRFGAALFGNNNRIIPGYRFDLPVRKGSIRCRFDSVPLMPGMYTVDLYLGNEMEDLDIVCEALSFEIQPDDVFGSGKLPPAAAGPIWVSASWAVDIHPERIEVNA